MKKMRIPSIILFTLISFILFSNSILANEQSDFEWNVIDIHNTIEKSDNSKMETKGVWKEQKDALNFTGKPVWKFEKQDGSYAIDWEYIKGKRYYFSEQGIMYQDKWMGPYYFGDDGAMVENAVYHGLEGVWKHDENGWWYQQTDGTYLEDCLEYINDKWYQFDENGYMMTGLIWNKEKGNLNFFNQDGALMIDAGWVSISNNKWVYIKGRVCLVNTITPDGYKIDETGIWRNSKEDEEVLKEIIKEFMEVKEFYIVDGKLSSITIGEIYRLTEDKTNHIFSERNYSTEFFIASQSYKYAFDFSLGGIKDHVSNYTIEEISIDGDEAIVKVVENIEFRYLHHDYEEDDFSGQVDKIWIKFTCDDGWKIYDIFMEEAFYMGFYDFIKSDLLSASDAKEKVKKRMINFQKNQHYGTDVKGTIPGDWIKDNFGWWYKHKDGTYTKNNWEMISGKWYYFNNIGYMVTGWIEDDSNWYYCDEDEAAVKGIQYIDNRWSRFDLNRKWIGYDD